MLPHDNMMNYIYSKLFPDTSYKFVPTGTSDKIVNMDIDELVSFHKMFYHPANSQAFCYGADDYVRNCLAGLQVYLDQFQGEKESIREASEVEWQDIKAISKQDERIPYASLTDNQDYRIAISWVLNDEPMDARTEVAWLLLEEVLIGTRTSLMSKRIHDLDIGDDIVGGLDHSVQQWIMTIGVNGLASEDQAVNARNEITDKLLRISEDGINEEALQAAANKVEYRVS
jgi:presequence protease